MTGLEITTDQTTDLFVANLFGWHSCGLPIISENVAKSVLKIYKIQLPTSNNSWKYNYLLCLPIFSEIFTCI